MPEIKTFLINNFRVNFKNHFDAMCCFKKCAQSETKRNKLDEDAHYLKRGCTLEDEWIALDV